MSHSPSASDSPSAPGGKPRYDSPCAVPMGQLSRGDGRCGPGTSDLTHCASGFDESSDCGPGISANVTCTSGPSHA